MSEPKLLWLFIGIIIGGAIVYIAVRGRTSIVHMERDEKGRLTDIIEKVIW